jgi:hypothetical protein
MDAATTPCEHNKPRGSTKCGQLIDEISYYRLVTDDFWVSVNRLSNAVSNWAWKDDSEGGIQEVVLMVWEQCTIICLGEHVKHHWLLDSWTGFKAKEIQPHIPVGTCPALVAYDVSDNMNIYIMKGI